MSLLDECERSKVMDVSKWMELAHQWTTDVLVWIGFGTVVGLLAKALLPGRDPGGAVTTLIMGILGCVFGCGTLSFFWQGHRVTPISLAGFLVGTTGAIVLLLFYRLLAGKIFREGEDLFLGFRRRSRSRRNV